MSQIDEILEKYAAMPFFDLCDVSTVFSRALDGDTVLHKIVAQNDIGSLVVALRVAGTADVIGDEGATLMHVAALHNSAEAASVLLESGATTSSVDNFGRTPQQVAEQNRSQAFLDVLFEFKGR